MVQENQTPQLMQENQAPPQQDFYDNMAMAHQPVVNITSYK